MAPLNFGVVDSMMDSTCGFTIVDSYDTHIINIHTKYIYIIWLSGVREWKEEEKKVKRVPKSNNPASFVKNSPRLVSPNAAPGLLYYIYNMCVYFFFTFPAFSTPHTTRTYILYLTGDRGPRRAEPFVNPLLAMGGSVGGGGGGRRALNYNIIMYTHPHVHVHAYTVRAWRIIRICIYGKFFSRDPCQPSPIRDNREI